MYSVFKWHTTLWKFVPQPHSLSSPSWKHTWAFSRLFHCPIKMAASFNEWQKANVCNVRAIQHFLLWTIFPSETPYCGDAMVTNGDSSISLSGRKGKSILRFLYFLKRTKNFLLFMKGRQWNNYWITNEIKDNWLFHPRDDANWGLELASGVAKWTLSNEGSWIHLGTLSNVV